VALDYFTRYKHHYALLEFRKAELRERFTIFRSAILPITATLSGFNEILRFELNENITSDDITEFCQKLSDICIWLQHLSERLIIEDSENETMVSEKFVQVSDYRHVAEDMRTLSSFISRHVLPQSVDPKYLSEVLLNYADLLEANWEVLISADTLNIPSEVHEAHAFHMEMRHGDIGSPDHRSIVLSAATHPFHEIRKDSAILLRHYDDQSSLAVLISLLVDEKEEIVGLAADSLRHLRKREVVPILISVLNRKFENQAYLGWIAEALASMPDETALDSLIAQLDYLLQGSVASWQTQVYPIAGFRKAIASIGGEKAQEALERYFDNPEI
jgi:hypothetical protein